MTNWKDMIKKHHNTIDKGDDIVIPFIGYDEHDGEKRWFDDILSFDGKEFTAVSYLHGTDRYMGTEIFTSIYDYLGY